jgi:23S rRNA pseudouridine1911/1915/1917 synthase
MQILHEDNHLIAINKQVSEIVQGDITGDVSLDKKVKQYIKEKYNKPGDAYLGVTHRLDRPASGVLIFARTSKALSRLNEMFRNNDIRKTYWAIVKKPPPLPSGELMDYMIKNQKQNKSYCYNKEVKGSKKAELSYAIIGSSTNYYLVEVELKTGRHHQIRAQLANIGSPIKGDIKYGFPRTNEYSGIALHARKVEFTHPVKKTLTRITAEPPEEEKLWRILQKEFK